MDKLNDEERLIAWKSIWHPSLVGIAIVDADLTIRSVNPQFCKLLGVQPSALIGKQIAEVTSAQDRDTDLANAKLLMDGYADFYSLQKTYEFPDGRRIPAVLLVARAPASDEGEFRFFVSRILLTENEEELSTTPSTQPSSFAASYLLPILDFMMTYGKWFAALGTIVGAIVVALMGQ